MGFTNDEVAQRWAQGLKGKGSNMYTDGTTIYSYGEHFPIATRNKGIILFNDDKYSVTTRKHQSIVGRYCNGEVYLCTTDEVRQAVQNPNLPVILTRM